MTKLRGMSKAYSLDDMLKDEYSINLKGKKYPLLSKTFKGFVSKTTKTGKTLFNKIFNGTDAEKEEYIKNVSSVLNLKVDIEKNDVDIKNKNIDYDTMILKNQKNKIVPDDPAYIRELAQMKENEEQYEENNEEYEAEIEEMRRRQAYREYLQNQRNRQYQPVQPVQQQIKYAKGGKVHGASHKNGGVKMKIHKHNKDIEVEGGEYIINKEATKHFEPELNKINKIGLELRDPKNNDKRDKIRKKILELKNKKYEKGGKVKYDEFVEMFDDPKFAKGGYADIKKIVGKENIEKDEVFPKYFQLDTGSKRKFYKNYKYFFDKYVFPYIQDNDKEIKKLFPHLDTVSGQRDLDNFYKEHGIRKKEEEREEMGREDIGEIEKQNREQLKKEQMEKEQIEREQIEKEENMKREQMEKEEREKAEANKFLSNFQEDKNQPLTSTQPLKSTQPYENEKISGFDIRDDGKIDKSKFKELQKFITLYFGNDDVDFSRVLTQIINKEKDLTFTDDDLRKKIEEILYKIGLNQNEIESLKILLRSDKRSLIKQLYFELKTIQTGKKIYDEKKREEGVLKGGSGNIQKGAVVSLKSYGGAIKSSDVANNINNNNGNLNIEELEKKVQQKEPLYKITNQGQKSLNTFNELSVNRDLIKTEDKPDTIKRKMFNMPDALYNVDDRYQGRYCKDIKNVEDEYKMGFKFRIKNNNDKKGRRNLSII